jgi:hypothetical protein
LGFSVRFFESFTREKNGIAARSPNLSRRGLIIGAAASLIAAPAIVRAASLMSVKALPRELLVGDLLHSEVKYWIVSGFDAFGKSMNEKILYGDLQIVTAPQWKYVNSIVAG